MKITIKELRNMHCLTLDEMAKKIDVKVEVLNKWEEMTDFPNVFQINRLLTLFDINYNDLIFF